MARHDGHLPIGFNDSAYLLDQLDLQQTVDLHRTSGSRMWRLPLDWGAVERSPGTLDFARYDEIYCAAVEAGVAPLWHLTGIPAWAAPGGACPDPCVRPPEDDHLDAMRRFAEIAAIRYPRSAAFEAWNEPNHFIFWHERPDPATYQGILEAIYTGVKDGNPDMPVLGGALSNNPTDEPNGDLSLATFLGAMVDNGALEYLDGFSMHPYPIEPLGTEGDAFTPALEIARSSLAEREAGVHIWVTELGVPTEPGGFSPQVTAKQQAAMLSDAYLELDRSDDTDAVLFHTLVDPGPQVPGGPGYGFFTAPVEGSVAVKPVMCAIRGLAGTGTGCPSRLDL